MQATRQPRTGLIQLWQRQHPARRIFAGFVALNLVGWGLLMLPISRVGAGAASWIEALFTAVSAACVTGLTVVDTALFWSPFGQVVIAVLIQLGGLGVMVFASLIGIFVVRRLTLGARLTTAQEVHAEGPGSVRQIVISILRIALVVEGAVTIALWLRFWLGRGEDPLHALWLGAFHAVSSYNNAGFALFSDNLIGFSDDPWILLPLAAATIVGGLGFPVIMQIVRHVPPRQWSMHTWLVLTGTAALLSIGTAAIAVLEWSNPGSLGPLSPGTRILDAFFHSVQTRTAGFNALDIGQFEPETLLVMDVLMFIGGGPAGTAGGIKITTVGVLAALVIAEVRGDAAVTVFGKRLSRAVHREAITVVMLAVGLVFAATVTIMLLTDLDLDRVLFEVVSAFGTVGLSTGITASLGTPSQLILVLLMFLGRVGPITVATAIALHPRRLAYELPKERPVIG